MKTPVADLPSRLRKARNAFAIMAAAPDRGRRRRAAAPYLGDGLRDAAARDLAQVGFSPWSLASDTVADLLSSYGTLRKERAEDAGNQVVRHTSKAFFQPDLSTDDLRRYPIFLQAALAPQLLRVLTKAAGLVPHLEAVEVLISNPVPGALTASQLWHRDVNDKSILKLFIYLNDVGPQNGPFTYIPAPASAAVPRSLPHYIDDLTVEKIVGNGAARRVEGPAGTAFLIDTRHCLHCGSRCREQRVAYIATYSSGLKFMHQSRMWETILGARAGQLDNLQRQVCGLPPIGA